MRDVVDLVWRSVLAAGLLLMGLDLARATEGPQAAAPGQPAAAGFAEPSGGRAFSREPQALYQQHCAACHGAQRTGAMGPALLPESLERLRRAEAIKVITQGRIATQMQGFQGQLAADQIAALAQWIYTPVSPAPVWAEADIRASRIQAVDASKLPNKPEWAADPMNLFVVVEGGDHHVSLVDGDRFEPIHRFASRYALHGGPKFTPDGRFVYLCSRDGWITKYDLWNLTLVAEVRAGLNTRNVAVSGDGRWVLAANYFPHTLALFDAELNLVQTFAANTLDGKTSSRVSAVYDAAPRKSFIVALKDIAELWEISYDPKAEDIFEGLVHDYRTGEGIAKRGFLGVKRTLLNEPLDDFFFDQRYIHVLGATRARPAEPGAGPNPESRPSAQVINLNVRRRIATLPIAGMPHLGSGITFAWNGTTVMASPNLSHAPGRPRPEADGLRQATDSPQGLSVSGLRPKQDPPPGPRSGPSVALGADAASGVLGANADYGALDVIDMKTWKPVKTIPLPGPGFFLRSHEASRYAWTDSMMGASAKDTLTIIDKRTLEAVAQVREPGRTLAHVEFTKDGRYALASLWENDGALIVYDAATFKEVKRLKMNKPVGKYNVWNKINRSEGTSH